MMIMNPFDIALVSLFIISLIVAYRISNTFQKDFKNVISYKSKSDEKSPDIQSTDGIEHTIVDNSESSAERIQFFCQKLVFISLTSFLMFKGIIEVIDTFSPFDMSKDLFFHHIKEIKTLSYVANALAISCGLQLAFMLITNGPDEAIEPIMLGIASVILLMLSAIDAKEWSIHNSVSIVLLISCIAALFFLSKFLEKKPRP